MCTHEQNLDGTLVDLTNIGGWINQPILHTIFRIPIALFLTETQISLSP